jgi:uncharacterized protein (DUF2062 family)
MWLSAWRKKQASLRRSLKNTHLHWIWGRRLFHSMLWKTDRRSIAGGLALGLFIAFTPSIPFQMLLATCGAIYFRVNLPIALAACWITNPLTALPIYTAAWKLGKSIVEPTGAAQAILDFYEIQGKSALLILHGFYLWTGCLIFSTVSALAAAATVRLAWKVPLPFHHPNRTSNPDSGTSSEPEKERNK